MAADQIAEQASDGSAPDDTGARARWLELLVALLVERAEVCRTYADMDAVAAANRTDVIMASRESWDWLVEQLRAYGSAPELGWADELRTVSAELHDATETWAFHQTVAPSSGEESERARAAQQRYHAVRRDTLRIVDQVARGAHDRFGIRARRPSSLREWLGRNMSDPGNWAGGLALSGIVSFAIMRGVDLVLYTPLGVDPDEVGRDSIAVIPHAILFGTVLATGGVVLVSFLNVVMGELREVTTRWRQRGQRRRARATEGDDAVAFRVEPGPVALDELTRQRRKDESAARVIVGMVSVIALLALTVAFVGSVRDDIERCEADSAIDRAVLGVTNSPVRSINPRPDDVGADALVAYLGTGPNHVVLYNCDTDRVVRLPKGDFVVVTDAGGEDPNA